MSAFVLICAFLRVKPQITLLQCYNLEPGQNDTQGRGNRGLNKLEIRQHCLIPI